MENKKLPKIKGNGKGSSGRINIRLEQDVLAYYRTKANEHGVSISEYLRRLLTQGVIAETVYEIEERLKHVVAEINEHKDTSSTSLHDDVLFSIFTSEALLSAIVEARDTQKLYEAQDKAKARLNKLKGV
jgi:plasmid stability protein